MLLPLSAQLVEEDVPFAYHHTPGDTGCRTRQFSPYYESKTLSCNAYIVSSDYSMTFLRIFKPTLVFERYTLTITPQNLNEWERNCRLIRTNYTHGAGDKTESDGEKILKGSHACGLASRRSLYIRRKCVKRNACSVQKQRMIAGWL